MPIDLTTRIEKAWKRCQDDHQHLRINSERSLQASFWAGFMALPNSDLFEIFFEPGITMQGKKVFPDLIICQEKVIVAVLELKFTPRGNPKIKKDLRTLDQIQEHHNQLHFVHRRHLKEPINYHFFEETLYVWAGVYRDKWHAHISDNLIEMKDKLQSRFLHLHLDIS